MNNNATIAIIIAIILVGAGVWVFRGNEAMSPTDEAALSSEAVNLSTESNMPIVPPEGTIMEDGMIQDDPKMPAEKIVTREITVTGKSFSFSPATITVKKGEHVIITFKNSGGTHDWQLDEFGAATKKLNSGEEETIEFIADKAGSFEYYCSVGNHRAMGMKGTLTVQ